jgi:3-dehydroquinate synthase
VQITIDLGERSYPVIIGSGLLNKANEILSPYISASQVCIVSNEVVAPIYLETLEKQLSESFRVSHVILPDGEVHKNLEALNHIFSSLLEEGCNRDVTLIALGGGVVGDMTGFAAASFMRGVNFIQIPTTLLAQVDSSVGGKTGVNHRLGKNMIGAFYQPKCVVADVATLNTLPERELSAGLAEVIKYGLIQNQKFLYWLKDNMTKLLAKDEEALAEAVKVSCESKAYVVAEDEKEKGLRAILNLGHTFGHAIEAYYQYDTYLHGEAVAIGTAMALNLSCALGMISEEDKTLSEKILASAQLPLKTKAFIEPSRLLEFMKVDKKAQGGQIRLVLLQALGEAKICDDISIKKIESAMLTCMPSA